YINTLDNIALYREGYLEADYQSTGAWLLQAGVKLLQYNQEVYQVEPNVPMLNAITPFAEASYRFGGKKSIRAEFQYMATKQDYGSWIYGLLEYDIAPKWSFSASDMYN